MAHQILAVYDPGDDRAAATVEAVCLWLRAVYEAGRYPDGNPTIRLVDDGPGGYTLEVTGPDRRPPEPGWWRHACAGPPGTTIPPSAGAGSP